MTSLPEGEGSNDAISALQALVFDETPDGEQTSTSLSRSDSSKRRL